MSRRNAYLLRVALMVPHAGMGSGRSSFAYVQTISPAFFFGSHGPSFGTCRTRQGLGCACFRKDDAADSRPHSKVARQAGRCHGEHYCSSSVPPWRDAQARQGGVAWPEARRNSPQRRFHECGTSQDCQGDRRHLPGEVVPNHGEGPLATSPCDDCSTRVRSRRPRCQVPPLSREAAAGARCGARARRALRSIAALVHSAVRRWN